MRFSAANGTGAKGGTPVIDELVRQIGRLLRHPAYRRGRVVSPLLLRHLPADAGYAWQGEATLRERLILARIEGPTLAHLLSSVRDELTSLRGPTEA